MPNPSDRNQRDSELAAMIAVLFRAFAREVEQGLADWGAFSTILAEIIGSSVADTYRAAANALAVDQVGGELTDSDKQAAAYGEAVGQQEAAAITARTHAMLVDGLNSGGVNVDAILSEGRAKSIAITQTTEAISAAEAWAAQAVAAITRSVANWRWRIDPNSNVCSVCQDLNGQLNPDIEPPAHPGCACDKEWSFAPLGMSSAGAV